MVINNIRYSMLGGMTLNGIELRAHSLGNREAVFAAAKYGSKFVDVSADSAGILRQAWVGSGLAVAYRNDLNR
jgi:hypothetical protein